MQILLEILITWIIFGIVTIGAFNIAKVLTIRSRRPD